jgi:hypothetical protein
MRRGGGFHVHAAEYLLRTSVCPIGELHDKVWFIYIYIYYLVLYIYLYILHALLISYNGRKRDKAVHVHIPSALAVPT